MTIAAAAPLQWLGVALYHAGLHRRVIKWRRRKLRVLLYHACEDRESDFTAGLQSNTTPTEFAAHLDFFARHYHVIPLERAVTGDIPECAAVITFDDGYRSVLDGAAPLLRKRSMSATVFLVTRVVGNAELVWVNELNFVLRRYPAIARPIVARLGGCRDGVSPEAMIDAVRRRGDADAVRKALMEIRAAAGFDVAGVAAHASLYLTWDEVRSLQAEGFTFANHTATHPSLGRLSVAAQHEEIAEAQQTLREHDCVSNWLAYPFGDHGPSSRGVAERLGCVAILGVGLRAGDADACDLGRMPVSATSPAKLFAQLEVVEPLKAWLRGIVRAVREASPSRRAAAP